MIRDDLHPNERKRVINEIQRRKDEQPSVRLAIITGGEGITPSQLRKFPELLERIQPTELRMVGQTKKLMPFVDHKMVRLQAFHDLMITRTALRDSTVAIFFPKEEKKPTKKVDGVWDAYRFAKHRNIQCRVVMPDGSPYEGD